MPIANPAFAPPDIPPDEDFSVTGAAVGELVEADCTLNEDAAELVSSVDEDDVSRRVGTRVSLSDFDVDSAAFLGTGFDEVLEEVTASVVVASEVTAVEVA